MDRILALSIVGAAPGNVFGPAMSVGAMESFVQGGSGKVGACGGERSGRGARPAGKGVQEEAAAEGRRSKAAKGGAAGDARFDPALGGLRCFETIAPH